MSDIKLINDTTFQNVFNYRYSNKPLEKRIASSYLHGKGVTKIMDNMATSSTLIELNVTHGKISGVTTDNFHFTNVEGQTSPSLKRRIKHHLGMLFNIDHYRDNFHAKVVAIANAYKKEEKTAAIKAVKEDMGALQYLSPEMKTDRDVVLAAVRKNGAALQYASDELKNDKEIVLEAIKQHRWALFHASKELQADPEVRQAAHIV